MADDNTHYKNNFRYFLIYVIHVDARCRLEAIIRDIEVIKKNVIASIRRDYLWAYTRIRFGTMTENARLFRWSSCWGTRNFLRCSFETNSSSLPSLRIQHEKGTLASPTTRRSRRITTAHSSVSFICIQTTSRRSRST